MRVKYLYQLWRGGDKWSPWKTGWTDECGVAWLPDKCRVVVLN